MGGSGAGMPPGNTGTTAVRASTAQAAERFAYYSAGSGVARGAGQHPLEQRGGRPASIQGVLRTHYSSASTAGAPTVRDWWAQTRVEDADEGMDASTPWADLLLTSDSETENTRSTNSGSQYFYSDIGDSTRPFTPYSTTSDESVDWVEQCDGMAATPPLGDHLLPTPPQSRTTSDDSQVWSENDEGLAPHAVHDDIVSNTWVHSLASDITLSGLPVMDPAHESVLHGNMAGPPAGQVPGANLSIEPLAREHVGLPPGHRDTRAATEPIVAIANVPTATALEVKARPASGTASHGGKKAGSGRCPLCNEEHERLSRFWRKYGYGGPPYCLRCAELFRSHQITCSVKAGTCRRDNPCSRCASVFAHFTKPLNESFAAMDSAQPQSRGRPAYVRPGGDGNNPCPLCKKTNHGGLGAFWNSFGYSGPPYCTSCSTSFRNHIVRNRGASRTGCSLSTPCVTCERVLSHFDDRDAAAARINSSRGGKCDTEAVKAAKDPVTVKKAVAPESRPKCKRPPARSTSGAGDIEMQDFGQAAQEERLQKRLRRHERVGAIKALGTLALIGMVVLLMHSSRLWQSTVGAGDGSGLQHDSASLPPPQAADGLGGAQLCATAGDNEDAGYRHGTSGSTALCRATSVKDVRDIVSAEHLACVTFTAPFCKACSTLEPRLQQVSMRQEFANISFIELSLSSNADMKELAQSGLLAPAYPNGPYGMVVPVPSVWLFRNGAEIKHVLLGELADLSPAVEMLQGEVVAEAVQQSDALTFLGPAKFYCCDGDGEPPK